MTKKIQLTSSEELLYNEYKQFDINDEHSTRTKKLEAAHDLTLSLMSRDGIPENRLKYFVERDYQTGGIKKSRKEVFESNGTSGNNIYRHGNYLKHLDFFIDGANVPQELYDFAIKALSDNPYQDDARDEIVTYINSNHLKPSNKNERRKFGDEIFKLAVDIGFDSIYCHDLRTKFSK